MSTDLKLTAADYERMVAKGAFNELPQKIELINSFIVSMNPAGPIHDDLIRAIHFIAATPRGHSVPGTVSQSLLEVMCHSRVISNQEGGPLRINLSRAIAECLPWLIPRWQTRTPRDLAKSIETPFPTRQFSACSAMDLVHDDKL